MKADNRSDPTWILVCPRPFMTNRARQFSGIRSIVVCRSLVDVAVPFDDGLTGRGVGAGELRTSETCTVTVTQAEHSCPGSSVGT